MKAFLIHLYRENAASGINLTDNFPSNRVKAKIIKVYEGRAANTPQYHASGCRNRLLKTIGNAGLRIKTPSQTGTGLSYKIFF